MIVVRCDRCGRTGGWNTNRTLSINISSATEAPKQFQFCDDPDGGTVGCFRVVMAELNGVLAKTELRDV